MIWKTANDAASAFAEQSGYFAVLPSLIGFLIMACTAIFMAVALAILILAKVAMWVLIGTAPIFIACMLFEQTRSYGMGWFNQVDLCADPALHLCHRRLPDRRHGSGTDGHRGGCESRTLKFSAT